MKLCHGPGVFSQKYDLAGLQDDIVGPIDVGGSFVGPTQDRVLRVASDLDVETRFVRNGGEITCYRKVTIILLLPADASPTEQLG